MSETKKVVAPRETYGNHAYENIANIPENNSELTLLERLEIKSKHLDDEKNARGVIMTGNGRIWENEFI